MYLASARAGHRGPQRRPRARERGWAASDAAGAARDALLEQPAHHVDVEVVGQVGLDAPADLRVELLELLDGGDDLAVLGRREEVDRLAQVVLLDAVLRKHLLLRLDERRLEVLQNHLREVLLGDVVAPSSCAPGST